MIKASTKGRCQTTGNEFGGLAEKKAVLLFAVFAAFTTVSCVSPLPAGESVGVSVTEAQTGQAEKGLPVRWGGTIARIHNKADLTVLEIVSRPLLRSGRPKHNDTTDGRFMAEISGFLDPEIVSPGRDISVIGTLDRIQTGQVGEADYKYPVLSVFDYQFWKKQSEIDPYSNYPNYLFSDRYWREWPHRRRSGVNGLIVF